MARHVFYRTSISYCMQNKYSSNACRCSTSVNNLICNWLVLPLCFILQTAVFHREPATALTATERPRFWGTFLAPPVSSRVCVCVSPTLTHTHTQKILCIQIQQPFSLHTNTDVHAQLRGALHLFSEGKRIRSILNSASCSHWLQAHLKRFSNEPISFQTCCGFAQHRRGFHLLVCLGICIVREWWQCQKNPLLCRKMFTLAWVGF